MAERSEMGREQDGRGAVDLADPGMRAAWLAGIRSHVEDIISAAMDATAPPSERDFGRREARRIISEAAGALRHSLDVAGAPAVDAADAGVRSHVL